MDQKKTGEFLKELRTQKQMTQEQVAERFNVSSRTVSRWETGRNMPDISLLTEIADFYEADVREIIEGERKSEMMDKEIKDVADKMADYAHEERGKLLKVIQVISIIGVIISFISIILQTIGYHRPENISIERTLALLASLAVLVIMSVTTLYVTGLLRKITNNKVLMTVIIVLTGVILTVSIMWILAAYLIVGMFALIFYSAKIKVYEDVAEYNEYIHNPKNGGEYQTCNGEMFEIFPESIEDPSKVEEFKFVYYNPWDAQYITYLTINYDEDEYNKEIARLQNLGIEEYKDFYSVSDEPSGYDLVAMNSDPYYGFVYALIPENEEESGKITYVGIWFCNYFLDLDIKDYVPNEYLLKGFDATEGNPYRQSNIYD